MPTSPKSRRTEPRTQVLPEIPIKEMKMWDRRTMLRWIQQRNSSLLEGDDLKSFDSAAINGEAFLYTSYDFFRKECGILPGPSLTLTRYRDEVLSTATPSPKDKRKRDDESVAPESPTSKLSKRRYQSQEKQKDRPDDDDKEKNDHDHDFLDHDNSHDTNNRNNAARYKEPEFVPPEKRPEHTRQRRKLIEKIIKDLHIEYCSRYSASTLASYSEFRLPGTVALLSDPKRVHVLPFPIVDVQTPAGFAISEEEVWRYTGREKFPELLRELKFVLRENSYTKLWVYGNRGYGKSHLLAALVCYLSALGEHVIYVPDCRVWLNDPVKIFQEALWFAFTDKAIQDEIAKLDTTKKIQQFLTDMENRKGRILFVFDQMNAICVNETDVEHVRLAKGRLTAWISCLLVGRKAVVSSSSNNGDYLREQIMQDDNHTMRVYGGLTEAEMKCWWAHRPGLDLRGYSEKEIEELTGCIPLLLNECVMNGEINLSPLRDVADKAVTFTEDIKMKTKDVGNQAHWNMHCEYVKACILNSPVPSEVLQRPYLIDHRFFFQRGDAIGGYSCGVVRNAVTEALIANQQYFSDSRFLRVLPTFHNNPSTTGFFMEYAVLFYLQLHGLPCHQHLAGHIDMITSKTAIPDIQKNIKGRPVIYHPVEYNYKTLDGLIVLIEEAVNGQKEKLFLYPYQVTLHRKNHKDSHAIFFDNYDQWVAELREFEVVTEFIWFSADESLSSHHAAVPASEGRTLKSGNVYQRPGWPAHKECVVNFGDLNTELWAKYQEAQEKAEKEKANKNAQRESQKRAQHNAEREAEKASKKVEQGATEAGKTG
ncbi:uncharacterized protein Z518_06100 [Rhinocladiella mackenziei CBS 650.93]|uniref:ATPase domain-containing protein n=1 Tax=Rhinocladiella mackenziei CBS 650.93 TaxID=1442369 RepID=A0A0D2H484_9EURO|nr:uncharacterized protein Z518_06100 [Rhinocladiella mackenziei CBS 650.93]KIX05228.1 hypothetical protein Z518_06100 [Rhinocladiella mackenziei CBS 650.93]